MNKKLLSTYRKLRAGLVFSFPVYVLCLLVLLLARHNHYPDSILDRLLYVANFVPFRTISGFARGLLDSSIRPLIVLKNLAGNLVAFLPMGFYLPGLFRHLRGFWKTVSAVYLIVLACEIVQLVTALGCFDVDDIILNVLGGAAGYGLYKLAEKYLHFVFA